MADIVGAIKQALYSGEFKDPTGLAERQEVNMPNSDENVLYSLRQKPEPEKKGTGYKVFVLGKDGKLYPPMVANPNGAATPVGVWLDADAAPVAGESKTGRPQVKQGGKGTQGGSGKLAYRPGWHLGVIPYAIQFNRKDAEVNKTLFPKNFVFAEVEYAADKDYQDEAHAEGINSNGKYQHSLAGLKHLPTDGYYMYRTNPNPETDPWVITGAMKVNRLLTRAEQADIVRNAGREPQKIQEGDIVTDDVVNSINQEIAAAPKFSVKEGINHGYTQRENGDKISKNAYEAEEDGTYSHGTFKRKYKVAARTFPLLQQLGVITNTEWHHTGRNFSKTGFYTWADSDRISGGTISYADGKTQEGSIAANYKEHKQEVDDIVEGLSSKRWEFTKPESTEPLTYEAWLSRKIPFREEDYLSKEEQAEKQANHERISADKSTSSYYRGESHKAVDQLYYNVAREHYQKELEDNRQQYEAEYKQYESGFPGKMQKLKEQNFGTNGKEKDLMRIYDLLGYKDSYGQVIKEISRPLATEDIDRVIGDGEKFSVKSNVDNQGNPLNQDGTLKLDKIKSVDDLTDEDFTNATRNVQLPTVPQNVDAAIGANGKPVIIKKNIFEKNWGSADFSGW